MGITTKRIRGVEYLYFTERGSEAGKTKFRNCGRANTREAQLKAARLECARLERAQMDLNDALDGLRSRIRELEAAGDGSGADNVAGPKDGPAPD